jgi:CheY-like chemotaxis protein
LKENRRVLIIDDEPHIRRVIELKLKNRGYQVMMAKDGAEGLEIIKAQKPDAVITDINMPNLDGRALCEHTQNLKKVRPFLTIVITARIRTDEEEWLERMDNTEFMEKPFSPSKLVDCIDKHFASQEG